MSAAATSPATAPVRQSGVMLTTLLLWTVELVISVTFTPRDYSFTEVMARVGSVLVIVLFGGAYCLAATRILNPTPVGPRLWLILGVMALVGGAILVAVDSAVFELVWRPLEFTPRRSPSFLGVWVQGWWFSMVFLVWSGIYLALRYEREARLRDARVAEVEAMVLKAENQMLRYQLNPHFLLNTMSALSALVMADRKRDAEDTILMLSRFLKRALRFDVGELTPLAEELEAERDFLEIQRKRFPDRLTFIEQVDAGVTEAATPPLILQPILENATKYGLSEPKKRLTITLEARLDGEDAVIIVRDDGPGGKATSRHGSGIGLVNVRDRLRALYGDRASVKWGPLEPRGFEVTLRYPAGGAT